MTKLGMAPECQSKRRRGSPSGPFLLKVASKERQQDGRDEYRSQYVNPHVASIYGAYDLSRVVSALDQNSKDLLADKIHAFVAADDDFGLDRPVRAFQKAMAASGVRGDLRFLESGGHAVWTDEVRKAVHDDMDRRIAAAAKRAGPWSRLACRGRCKRERGRGQADPWR